MSYEQYLARAEAELMAARASLGRELRDYPTPVSGCDAQFNHMIGLRNAVTEALSALQAPSFVATPRTPHPGAGIESR